MAAGSQVASGSDAAGSGSAGRELLDTPPEELFDGVVALAARALRAPFAFFSIIDSHRVWFKSRYGTDLTQLDLGGSFCAEAVRQATPLVVPDALADSRFAASGIVTEFPHIRFYAGVPVCAPDGTVMGTLCVLDTQRREIAPQDLGLLQSFAQEIEFRVALRSSRQAEQRLLDERAILINMVLHDARGMLSSLGWSLDSLEQDLRPPPDALVHSRQAVSELSRLCNSMASLNDVQSSRIKVEPRAEDLHRWFELLGRRATRIALTHGLTLVVDNRLPETLLKADVHVVDRILMNLIRNACTACAEEAGSSILIEARVDGGEKLLFTVSDDGPGIPEDIRARIFDPYFTYGSGEREGTGLGLAFARLAAQAMGGTIEFLPRDPSGSEFRLSVPVEEVNQ